MDPWILVLPPLAIALLLGISADTAVKGVFGTVDLTWVEGVSPSIVAAGLTVAIPSLIGYRYLRGKVDNLVVQMEKEAMKFLEALLQHQSLEVIANESPKRFERRA